MCSPIRLRNQVLERVGIKCGGDEYILDAARCTHNVGGPPAESVGELIGQLIPPRATFQSARSGESCWWQCDIRMVRLWSEICEQLSHRRVNWDAEPVSHGGRQASKVNVGRDFVLLLADKHKRTNKTASRNSRADRDCDET